MVSTIFVIIDSCQLQPKICFSFFVFLSCSVNTFLRSLREKFNSLMFSYCVLMKNSYFNLQLWYPSRTSVDYIENTIYQKTGNVPPSIFRTNHVGLLTYRYKPWTFRFLEIMLRHIPSGNVAFQNINNPRICALWCQIVWLADCFVDRQCSRVGRGNIGQNS